MEILTKKQQEERANRRRVITEAWSDSADARGFIAALEKKGYYLARGENRSYVAVDLSGEVHSLTRQIDGVKPKEIRSRLEGISLPGIQAAQDRARQGRSESLSGEQHREEKNLLETIAPYALVIISVLLAYANIYSNTFLFDDFPAIVLNSYLRHWSNLPDLLTGLSTAGSGQQAGFHRPMLMLIWFFTYQAFGPSTFAFHGLNVLLHTLNSCLVFRIGCCLGLRRWASLLAAQIWAVHPLNSEAVDYISSADDPLYVFFLLLGILVLLPDFTPRRVWSAGLILMLGLASKESAVVFPALATITLWLVSKERLNPATYYKTWPLWFLAGVFIVLWVSYIHGTGFHVHDPADVFYIDNYTHSFTNRVLTFFATLPVYFGLMVWPIGLHMERSLPIFTNLWSWQVLTGIAMVSAVLMQMAWGQVQRGLALSWGFLWFAISYSPYSGIVVPVDALIAERWMYLPTIGLALGIALTLQVWLDRRSGKAEVLAAMLLAVTALALGVKTHIQNKVWRNPETFYGNIIANGEISGRAHNNLGVFYLEQGEFEKAIEQYRLAIAHPGEQAELPRLHIYLAAAYLGVRVDPENDTFTLQEVFQALHSSSHVPEAIQELNTALDLDPNMYMADAMLAEIYHYQGDNEKALFYKNQAETSQKSEAEEH
ncbi:MAG: hypothetical protein ACM3WP_06785 [Acidobacteriota bacterium]